MKLSIQERLDAIAGEVLSADQQRAIAELRPRDKAVMIAGVALVRDDDGLAREIRDILEQLPIVTAVIPDCTACNDTGLVWVLVGPEDGEREPCDQCDAWDRIIEATPMAEGAF